MVDPDPWPQVPVRRQDAAAQVLHGLRDAIESGRFGVGERLPAESALAERFGVGRAVVREALRSLRALGLTDTRTGSGTYVVSTFPRPELEYGGFTAEDLLEARPHIEVPAAGWAALRHTPEQAEGLVALCDRMDAEQGAHEWVHLDSEFHRLIADASGNRVFARVVGEVREAVTQQSQMLNLVARRREGSNGEHRTIAEAIMAGDEQAAREAMLAHLGQVESVVSTLLETRVSTT